MIYIAELTIDNREVWGNAIHFDIPIPSRIRHIRGYMANIVPSEHSILKADIVINDTTNEIDTINYKCVPIGSISLSLNNTDVISSNSPAYILSHRNISSYNRNKEIFDKPIPVMSGSVLRVCYEERQHNPFRSNNLDEETAIIVKKAHFSHLEDLPDLTNSYTLKIYIDYD